MSSLLCMLFNLCIGYSYLPEEIIKIILIPIVINRAESICLYAMWRFVRLMLRSVVFEVSDTSDFPKINLNGIALKKVNNFKCLGHMLTSSLRDDDAIERERKKNNVLFQFSHYFSYFDCYYFIIIFEFLLTMADLFLKF